ncbi:fatty acid-binding protein 10-A, liver basic [Chanos chanos]|uniref:Fatty acid-binding protein 10-A, liver basic n=1 Tax=Chanos chanos TaxID=29144 RepID=A0A6J2WNX0_CHACN|nr:fatty acid-binding protein 10-A, liver basic-like [Chanos chanos]
MDFNGTWQMYVQENPEEFLKAISAPEIFLKMIKEVKPVTTIQQNGDNFVITVKTTLRSNTNSFTIGKEAEITTIDGKKMKTTPKLVDGKLVIETDLGSHVREIQGGDMVETLTAGTATLIRRSRRV